MFFFNYLCIVGNWILTYFHVELSNSIKSRSRPSRKIYFLANSRPESKPSLLTKVFFFSQRDTERAKTESWRGKKSKLSRLWFDCLCEINEKSWNCYLGFFVHAPCCVTWKKRIHKRKEKNISEICVNREDE